MSFTLPPGVRDQTARNITARQIEQWIANGANYKNTLNSILASIVKDLRLTASPAKAINRTIKKLERFFENKEIRGAINIRNQRTIQFELIFPTKIENGLGFHFLIGELMGRSGRYKLTESAIVQISTHALQRLLERISSRNNTEALNEIYSSMRVASAWNAAGLKSGAQYWPIVSQNGFFVAAPGRQSCPIILITWIKKGQVSNKWGSFFENFKELEKHNPKLVFDTHYVEQFIRSFTWMSKEYVPGVDLEELAWESRESDFVNGEILTNLNDNLEFRVGSGSGRKQTTSYVPGWNYCDAPPFKEYSQHTGLVVQKSGDESLIISLQNGYFSTILNPSIRDDELKQSKLETLNIGDSVEVEVTRIIHHKSDEAYVISVVTKDLADILWQKTERKYQINCQVDGHISRIYGAVIEVRVEETVFGLVSKKRLMWWLEQNYGLTNNYHGVHVKLKICGHRTDKRRLLLDLPNYDFEYEAAFSKKFNLGQLLEAVVTYTSHAHALLSLDSGFEALLRRVNCWGTLLPQIGERIVVQVLLFGGVDNRIIVGLPSPTGLDTAFAPMPLTEAYWNSFEQKHFVGEAVQAQIADSFTSGFLVSMSDGATGLLPYMEIDWPADEEEIRRAHTIGDFLDVQIVKINISKKKIHFSRRILIPHPLYDLKTRLVINAKYTVPVAKAVDYGYFVRFFNGVNGLLHKNNIPESIIFNVGESIQVYVTDIDIEKKRISVSLSNPEVEQSGFCSEVR